MLDTVLKTVMLVLVDVGQLLGEGVRGCSPSLRHVGDKQSVRGAVHYRQERQAHRRGRAHCWTRGLLPMWWRLMEVDKT